MRIVLLRRNTKEEEDEELLVEAGTSTDKNNNNGTTTKPPLSIYQKWNYFQDVARIQSIADTNYCIGNSGSGDGVTNVGVVINLQPCGGFGATDVIRGLRWYFLPSASAGAVAAEAEAVSSEASTTTSTEVQMCVTCRSLCCRGVESVLSF